MGNRRRPACRRLRVPTPLRSCTPRPPQPLGCGPLLREHFQTSRRCNSAADGNFASMDDAGAVAPHGGGMECGRRQRGSVGRGDSGCCCRSRELVAARGSWRFEAPTALARRTAIGSNSGFPFMLQRVLRFSEVWFEPIPDPRPRDWLSLNPELMQTFDAFRSAFANNRGSMGPSPERQCLHLLPLGPGEPEPRLFSQLRGLCAAFFWPLRVAVLRVPADAPAPGPDGEIDADEVLAWMTAGLPTNSVLTLALTEAPLFSGGTATRKGTPTIGASDWAARVCVCSIENHVPAPTFVVDEPLPRILPDIGGIPGHEEDDSLDYAGDDSLLYLTPLRPSSSASPSPHLFGSPSPPPPPQIEEDLKVVFERIAKLIIHEAVHMFGILHCCYYRCLMNGSSTLEEGDSKPPYLCGMCLKKLHLVLGFEPLERYMKLAHAWASAERDDISRWYSTRVALVQTTLASCRGQPPGALAWQRSQTGRPNLGPLRPASSMSNSNAPRLRTALRASVMRPASSQALRERPRSPSSRAPSPEPDAVPATILTARDLAEAKIWPSVPLPPSLHRGNNRVSPKLRHAIMVRSEEVQGSEHHKPKPSPRKTQLEMNDGFGNVDFDDEDDEPEAEWGLPLKPSDGTYQDDSSDAADELENEDDVVPPEDAEQCECGNLLMPDAIFCRKCGRRVVRLPATTMDCEQILGLHMSEGGEASCR